MLRSLALVLLATGCLAPAPAVEQRFYELPRLEATPVVPPRGADERPGLRDVSVASRASVQRALTWRLSPVELTFDETASWLEEPAGIVRRALERRVFEIEGLRGSHQDVGLHLVVETFEGDLSGPALARVAFRAHLDEREARFEGSAPLAARNSEALAFGLGVALDEAFDALVAWLWMDGEASDAGGE